MEETTIGGMTVIEDGDFVSATREKEPEAPPSTPEPDAPPTPPPTPEPEPDAAAETAATDRDEQGRFKPKEKEAAKPPVERRKDSIQAQIDRARYELGEEQRRLERVRQERIQAEAQPAKPATPPPAATGQTFKEFVVDYATKNPQATYEDAIDAYRVVERSEMLRQLREEQQQETQGRELQTAVSAHRERVAALKATTPDWDAVVASGDAYMAARGFAVLPEVLQLAIIRSDKSAQIVRDLSEHPEIAIQRAVEAQELPSTPAAVTLMRTVLESRLSTSGKTAPPSGPVSPPIQSRSNPPPKPVGNSPVASAASDDEPSLDEMRDRVGKRLHPRTA